MSSEWWVTYRYDGGAGEQIVVARDAAEATQIGMAAAEPKWNPGAECRHSGTVRLLHSFRSSAAEIETVVDMSWDRRDRGGRYLVVERGLLRRNHGVDNYVLPVAKLVGTATTERGALRIETKARQNLRGCAGRIDVVQRSDVELRQSNAPYGCFSGERSSC